MRYCSTHAVPLIGTEVNEHVSSACAIVEDQRTAQEISTDAAERIRFFLDKIPGQTDPLALEAAYFAILQHATSTYRKLHDLNDPRMIERTGLLPGFDGRGEIRS